ncbi:MAG: hypothetical protein V6Z78_04295 [Holosporaceae bacterium]
MPCARPLSKSIKTITADESLCDDEEKPAVICDDGLGLSLRGEILISTRQSSVPLSFQCLASGSPQACAFSM